ncbi:MAG: beta-ketoacyl synthase N-terminal-like domain-containing protein [Salibacteraceae bacterium]
MRTFVIGHNIISPFGTKSSETYSALISGKSAIQKLPLGELSPVETFASRFPKTILEKTKIERFTKLESLMIHSIEKVINESQVDLKSPEFLLVISTTKGNIDLLQNSEQKKWDNDRAYLSVMANKIGEYFGVSSSPIVISNACISGGCSIEYAQDVLKTERYKNVVVCGGDLLTEFVLSGFRSFHAISETTCAPYDKDRDGINLGEAVATIALSSENTSNIELLSACTSNDANHISGPSRTGEGLYVAVQNALKLANLKPQKIDYISAHGTATNYNDEMESIAFTRCELTNAPLNSYKGYFGHTLGAAGIIEAIISCICLEKGQLLKSLGYQQHGVSGEINVIKDNRPADLKYALKTGSGFGGGNNAMIFEKI